MSEIKNSYTCSLILTNDLLGGKWKLRILWHIIQGDNRFSLLQKIIPDITHKMLIAELRQLESTGIIIRNDLSGKTLHVEYKLNEKYSELIHILDDLCNFTKEYAEENKIEIP